MKKLGDRQEIEITLKEAEKKGNLVVINYYNTCCGTCSLLEKIEKR